VQPLVSGPVAGQVGFSACTGNGQAPQNTLSGAIAAARSRGNRFFPETVFMQDALAVLSDAHAQASTSATHCAWWSAGGTNFPKGNNNNALKDVNDASVTFTSAGNATYPAFALAGSGAPFAKTTHNGQACGVSDVNGNINKVNPGMTATNVAKAISGATQTNPVQLTVAGHGLSTGQIVTVLPPVGMTQIADRVFKVTVVDADHITLDGVDGTGFSAYVSGGSVNLTSYYLLKPAADVTQIGGGETLATDHWGAAGLAALLEPVTLNHRTDYPNNLYSWRLGNGASQVFGWGSAAERQQTMAGLPTPYGSGPAGSAQMGNDNWYVRPAQWLCVISRGYWSNGSSAGARARGLSSTRASASYTVGFAASCFLTP